MKRHTIFDQTVLIVFYGIHCRPFGTIALTKKANLLHFMISCSITLGYKETCCLKVLLLEKKKYIYIYTRSAENCILALFTKIRPDYRF